MELERKIRLEKNEIISIFLMSVGILIFNNFDIMNRYAPINLPDEMGNWAVAGYINGQDWSGVMQIAPYYTYGYGLFLALLYVIPSAVWRYRIATLINSIFIILIAFLMYKFTTYVNKGISRKQLLLISFCVAIYTGNIYQAHLVVPEVFMTLVFCLMVYACVLYYQKQKDRYLVFMVLLSLVLYYSHQRNLGILLVSVLLAFVEMLVKKSKRSEKTIKIVGLFGCCILVVMVAELFKDNVVTDIYSSSEYVGKNDFSGQTSKIQFIFTMEGIYCLILNVIGRLFYLGCSTFGLFYVGLFSIGKRLIQKLFSARKILLVETFILLSFFSSLAISAISTINPYRIDSVMYGRYTEHLLMPILIYGIIELIFMSKKDVMSIGKRILFLQMGSALVVYKFLLYYEISITSAMSIPGVINMPTIFGENLQRGLTWGILLFSLIISLIFLVLVRCKKVQVALFIVSSLWLFMGIKMSYSQVNEEFLPVYKQYYDFAEENLQLLEGEKVYYIINDSDSVGAYYHVYRNKYFFQDVDIQVIRYENIESIEEGSYIFMAQGAAKIKEIKEKFVVVDEMDFMCILKVE